MRQLRVQLKAIARLETKMKYIKSQIKNSKKKSLT